MPVRRILERFALAGSSSRHIPHTAQHCLRLERTPSDGAAARSGNAQEVAAVGWKLEVETARSGVHPVGPPVLSRARSVARPRVWLGWHGKRAVPCPSLEFGRTCTNPMRFNCKFILILRRSLQNAEPSVIPEMRRLTVKGSAAGVGGSRREWKTSGGEEEGWRGWHLPVGPPAPALILGLPGPATCRHRAPAGRHQAGDGGGRDRSKSRSSGLIANLSNLVRPFSF